MELFLYLEIVNQTTSDIQKQYEGFLKTPNLWNGNAIGSLQQFILPGNSHKIDLHKLEPRLGKRVEQFVVFQFEQEGIPVITSNLQIQNGKETIGEIDTIIEEDNQLIHLEICYKFYLYDPTITGNETSKWIGPNRRDSLDLKLEKLQTKQFPLLQNDITKRQLSKLDINAESITQKVLFKSQLFLPADTVFNNKLPINENCIEGFYYALENLEQFHDCKFFIPQKPDWLMKPQTHINWLNYSEFRIKVGVYLDKKNAPLCWIKKPSGALEKIVVVWW